jgi:glyoxylase-like metal-dependent hydrolase (beta-lactamase superfamily II)
MHERAPAREVVPQDLSTPCPGPRRRSRRVGAAVFALALALPFVGCSLQDQILRTAFVGGADYVSPPGQEESTFAQHADHIYSYRYRFYRTLIVDTSEGIVVIDPMNEHVVRGTLEALRTRFPGKRVHTVFYSHYHLDHVRGAAALQPQHVVAHEKVFDYWKDLDTSDVLPPTETISGDQERQIGGVVIRLLDLGLSHTDTIYAFYFPEQKLVYSPDVGFVRSWPTPGPFNTYHFGYVRAMERLSALDFTTFVPSHGRAGTREDFVSSMAMIKDVRQTMAAAIARHSVETTEGLEQIFNEVYPVWKSKYGDWHGFDQMAGLAMVRQMAGVNLGY